MALLLHARWQWQWRLILCIATVAGSVVACLWVIVKETKNRRRVAGGPPNNVDGVRRRVDVVVVAAFDPGAVLWRSCWCSVHPEWLLALRATAAVSLAAVLLWDVRTYDPTIMLYYYTEWTFLLEIIYFVVATMFSAYGCFIYTRSSSVEQGINERLLCINEINDDAGMRCWLYQLEPFMQIIYQVCGGAVVLTDVVFWALIVPFMSSAHFSLNAVMICMHSLNIVFLLAETALNSAAFPWFRIPYFIIWTCLYVIIQWIAHVCGLKWWPYPFLDPTEAWAPLWYLSMALLHFPCYLVYWSIVRAKNWCHSVL